MTQREFEVMASPMRQRALLVARCCGVDESTAQDVAQDTLLRLWAMHNSLNNGDRLLALVATVSRHLAIDHCRTNRKTVPIDALKTTVKPDAETRIDAQEREQWLMRKIAALPSTEHQVLKMRQVEGRTNEEIAALLGITPDSVKTLLSRARKKMLEYFRKGKI